MKTPNRMRRLRGFPAPHLLALLAGLALLGLGCSKSSPTDPGNTDPIDPAQVNAFVNKLPDWEVPSTVEDPPEDLPDEQDLEDNQYYRCNVVQYDMKRNFDSIVAVGANATALKPGMLVQGNGVKDGSLSTIGLKRSPLLLSVNLALDTPSRRVDVPTSSSIQDAIASLQREADTRLGSIPVVPAMINFKVQQAYSFSQAMLSAGISLSYDAVFANGSVSSTFNQNSSVQSHSVVVKLLQPMYTISFADDEMAEPGDFFAEDVTQADFDRQRELGTMGPGNLPCYVQSVTYGRMLVYTMTSTEATSSQELQLAVQASYGAWEGSGQVDTRQKQLVNNSTIQVQVFGGTQQDQLDAIKTALHTGDFSAFLTEVPATTAVPLSYRINDLKNRQPAVIGDATKFSIKECEAVNDMMFTVSLDSITVVDGCMDQTLFDIESYVDVSGNGEYWLMHRSGPAFTREDLANAYHQAIFTLTADANTTITFTTNFNGAGGTHDYHWWSKVTTFQYPFDFPSNPLHFSHLDTTTNDLYDGCTMEMHYTIQWELQ